MITAEKPSEILRRLGHCKKYLQDITTRSVCTVGAVYCGVIGDDDLVKNGFVTIPQSGEVFGKLRSVMQYLGLNDTGDPLLAVGNWNDAPERTAEECIAALEACGL